MNTSINLQPKKIDVELAYKFADIYGIRIPISLDNIRRQNIKIVIKENFAFLTLIFSDNSKMVFSSSSFSENEAKEKFNKFRKQMETYNKGFFERNYFTFKELYNMINKNKAYE